MAFNATYDSRRLISVIEEKRGVAPFLIRNFFPGRDYSDTLAISFDKISRKRKLAPYVLPTAVSKVVNPRGYSTDTFIPPYIKMKTPFRPDRALQRLPGEPFGAPFSPVQRKAVLVTQDLMDLDAACAAREEVQAVEALRLGTVTVVGDEYEAKTVNFGRDAQLRDTIAGTARWGEADADPYVYMMNRATVVKKLSGVFPDQVMMGPGAYMKFIASLRVRDQLNLFRAMTQAPTLKPGEKLNEGGTLMGTMAPFQIWVYSNYYEDATDTTIGMLPDNEIIMAPAGVDGLEGMVAYGAIQDNDSLVSIDRFPKTWVENDPSVTWVQMQSAPLVVPRRVNACASSVVYTI